MKGGVGRQRGTKVREAGERVTGDSDPPVFPPPPPRHVQQKENPFSFCAAAIGTFSVGESQVTDSEV